MSPCRRALQWVVLAAAVWTCPAHAHKPSDSYLSLSVEDNVVRGRWDIALRDLEYAIGIDANGDGQITWGELRQRHGEIAAYATSRLALAVDNRPCALRAGEQLVDSHTDGTYTVLPLTVDCAGGGQRLSVRYSLFADIDPQHRGLLQLTTVTGTRSAVLDPRAPPQEFDLAASGRGTQIVQFMREGVWHIWIGLDHILFLLSLLLPAVLVWRPPRWEPAERLRSALLDVVKIVTAFTVAHSITLSLATLGVVSLPSALVESAIALSVVLAALNNVFPVARRRRWWVAFGFGLIHGFGFASVLADLGLPTDTLLLALLSFNLGVELGQLAIVTAFLPIAYVLRDTGFYRRAILHGGSWVIAALASVWFIERAFSLKILGF